ncbi:glycosyltransferase family 10 domain-containing protein [Christiangramia echinicola]|uniref:Glycosyltransferase family 10 (Fucosyltransferase) C-term n=1 Tax=Christiangramia echinicola TaxID=279359 RepID=A0A1H1QMQ5_9FLAO|nr:glycosyltransferase family 10 [Christiangramia echinicola]SDS24656.1 Glycosyltransferase family 10 (fucosyltransferase) C-term [Christiangramia echinicola]
MEHEQTIKIWFTDFYKGFDPYDNILLDLLNPHFRLEVDPGYPDFLIYSCHEKEFLNFNCARIFYTGENLVPDFNLCDYAIGFHHLQFNDRYLRFPNYLFFRDQFEKLTIPKSFSNEFLTQKQNFCNFIYANAQAHPARDEFFQALNEYKQVSSPGIHLNNMNFDVGERFAEDWMYTKLDFQRSCKFSIAFENTSTPGYVTEKIMHAFITDTIPIYWGDPNITKDFNPEAFINCHNFRNFEKVVEYVKKVDQDEELYLKILNAPAFPDNKIPQHLKFENLIIFFSNIFNQDAEGKVRRPLFGTCNKYEEELKQNRNKPGTLQKIKRKLNF